MLSAWSLNALGYVAMMQGDAAKALHWYEQYVTLIRDTENAVSRSLILPRAAEGFLLAGRVDEAATLVDQAIAITEFAGAPHYLGLAHRVRGQILVAQQQSDDAMRAYDNAIALFTKTGSRLELARVMHHRAALLFALHDSKSGQSARGDAARARDEFDAMGAVHDRALAERLLRLRRP